MKVLNLLVTGNPGGIETLCKNISLKKSSIDNTWMFIFYGGIVAEEMKKHSKDNVIILNEKKNFFKIIKTITKYCKENNIDVVTVHHGGTYTNLIYITLRNINKSIKFVRYLHSCYDTELLEKTRIAAKIYKFLLQKSIDKSDLVICVSNSVKDTHSRKLKLKNKNIKIIYNGVSDAFFQKIQNREQNSDVRNLIYVGRLEKEKCVDILIDALPIIKAKNNNINLLIVGEGSEINKLKERAINKGVSDIVTFAGKKLNVIKYLDKSDIFIHPTKCEEAFGIAIVEAMSRGCIPVAFNKGGIPEIIEEKKNGYLIDIVDSKKMAEKILEILNMNEKEIYLIRKNAMESAKRFTIDNTISELEKEYMKIMENVNE